MATKTSQNRDNRQGGGEKIAYVDTGCNGILIAQRTAEELQDECSDINIEWYEVQRQRVVNYGGSDKGLIIGRLEGNDQLNRIEIVEDLSDNLVGIRQWIDKGATVQFSEREGVVIRDTDEQGHKTEQAVGTYDAECGMFTMDLLKWIKQQINTKDTDISAHKAVGINRHRITAREKRLCMQFHKAMNHLPFSTMAICVECHCWKGVHHEITASALRQMDDSDSCLQCAAARATTKVSKGSGTTVAYQPGEAFAADYIGKYKETSRGATGAIKIIDMATGFRKTYGVTSKRAIIEAVRRWKINMAQHNKVVRAGHFDAGSVERGDAFNTEMAEMGISVWTTPDKVPQKDIERAARTANEDIAAIIANATTFQPDDWLTAHHISDATRNLVPNAKSRDIDPHKSPQEIITGKKPDVSILNEILYGDIVTVETPPNRRGAGIPRQMLGRIMEIHTDGSKSAHINYADKKDSYQRRGGINLIGGQRQTAATGRGTQRKVTVERNDMTKMIDITLEGEGEKRAPFTLANLITQQEQRMTREESDEEQRGAQVTTTAQKRTAKTALQLQHQQAYYNECIQITGNDEESDDNENSTAIDGTEWSRAIAKTAASEEDEYYVEEEGEKHITTAAAYKARIKRTENNPSTGMLEKDWDLYQRWKPSLEKEINGMLNKDAVERISEEEALNIGITDHVTTMKMKRQGEGQEKSRININGAQELRKGIFPDKKALYAPALGEEGILTLMATAAQFDMTLDRSDVTQAFMYNDMDRAVVKRDIVIKLKEVECGIRGGAYYKYKKLGYGAADASAVWAGQMAEFLQHEGQLTLCPQVTCLWIRLIGDRGLIMIGVATDDLIQAATRDRETQQVLKQLRAMMDKKWNMTHSPLETALGIKATRNQNGSITLTQPNQLASIKETFFPNGEVPETYAPKQKGQHRDEDYETAADNTEYRSKLGVITHLRFTRHDAKATMAIAAESSAYPTIADLKDLETLAAYIITTSKVGLTFQAGKKNANPRERVPAYGASDASWSMTKDARSRIAYFLCMGDQEDLKSRGLCTGAILAKSTAESSISKSAAGGELMAEVEFVDANDVYMQLMDTITGTEHTRKGKAERSKTGATQMKHKLTDEKIKELLPCGDPTQILVDNRSLYNTTLYASSKPLKKLKTVVRHINIIKEAIQKGEITQVLVGTKDQPADMLTKAHTSPTLQWMHLETIQGTHEAITEIKERVRRMKKERRSQGRMIQLTHATGEEKTNTTTAAVAFSDTDTREERAEKETQIETEHNTRQAAEESKETRQLRIDIKQRGGRKTYRHKTQRERIIAEGDNGVNNKSTGKEDDMDIDDDEEDTGKTTRRRQQNGDEGCEQQRQSKRSKGRRSKGAGTKKQQ